ncbi:GTP cyclohydrolase II [bacterium]|nr:GTP cyclohydrolase II [bacterium]
MASVSSHGAPCQEPVQNPTSSRISPLIGARLPTEHGEFQLVLYRDGQAKDHLAFVLGEVRAQEEVLVRIHSECFTGDVLGSLRCDCGPQLQQALRLIGQAGSGVLVYLRQEGRGIGLLDKLRAYNLQDLGFDTVDANLELGHPPDAREYSVAALILRDLGVLSLDLMTNNPRKLEGLAELGLAVRRRVPLLVSLGAEGSAYLETKQRRMDHWPTAWPQPWEPWLQARSVPAHRPLVTLCLQQSLDGTLARSGAATPWLTQSLRDWHDSVLVGVGRLPTRAPAGCRLIVLDRELRFPCQTLPWVQAPWIVGGTPTDPARKLAMQALGAIVLESDFDGDGRVELVALLERLRKLGVHRLLVEGGLRIFESFLGHACIDLVVASGASSQACAMFCLGTARVSRANWEGSAHGGILWAALQP